jgi:hypothetical protein
LYGIAIVTWGVYLEPERDWLSDGVQEHAWREHYLAVDELGEVHGGFVLKPQDWLVRGAPRIVTDWQGPVSEGSVDSRYATLALRLMREMTKLYPAIYSWGHGGSDQPVVRMLEKMKWPMHSTPLCMLVLKPYRFARLNSFLRRTRAQRLAMDAFALSGIGPLVLRFVHWARRFTSGKRFEAHAYPFERFEDWADSLWESCKGKYSALAVRHSVAMNRLTPESGWPPVTRLRIEKDRTIVGWALVMNTEMRGDARFGDLHVGSLVDCFSDPLHAGEVVSAATNYLRGRGVDVVVSNQSHPGWIRGFAENGYLIAPNRRLFVMSPGLREVLEPFDEIAPGLHLTNMDGHGPHAL